MSAGQPSNKAGVRKSPRDTACRFCGKLLTRKGCAEHERRACKKNPRRRKRSFSKVVCRHCGKAIHETGLRVHVALQHPEAWARSPTVKAHRKRPRGVRPTVSVSPVRETRDTQVRDVQASRRVSSKFPDHPRSEAKVPETRAETEARIWREVQRRGQEAKPHQGRKS